MYSSPPPSPSLSPLTSAHAGVWVGRTLLHVQPHPHSPTVLLPWAQRKYPCGLGDYTPHSPLPVGDLCLIYFVLSVFLNFPQSPREKEGHGAALVHRPVTTSAWSAPAVAGRPEKPAGQWVSGTGWHRGKQASGDKDAAQSPTPSFGRGVRGWCDAEPGGLALSQAASDPRRAHLPLHTEKAMPRPWPGLQAPGPRES